eukprot:comp24145_c0_seq1/m.43916 comp24145_c0_seq1/g.43916  ORF comp24145_c0_seq1/g.43916 comp24145_c0_seq1/m.43916 type:complete len:454 (-) comp24145_c0_seq1:495-1856(-)
MASVLVSQMATQLASQPQLIAAASTASFRYAVRYASIAREQRRYKSTVPGKNVFVLNCGSSSIKYQLLEVMGPKEAKVVCQGLVERIGEKASPINHKKEDASSDCAPSKKFEVPLKDHSVGLAEVCRLVYPGDLNTVDLYAIGHRVVHGGEKFARSVVINNEVVQSIKDNVVLAPLHNPGNLMGIEVATKMFPRVPQVACFDTSFHQTMPPHAFMYPINYKHYQKERIRRYGFHGTSHAYVAARAAEQLGKPLSQCNLITLHIGNGASVAAIQNGKVIDTSMGLTPLEGLMMGTRCGDVDASIPLFLESQGYSSKDINTMLTKQSGLAGICGHGDLRDVISGYKEGKSLETLAFNMYIYRIKKYIGSYMAALSGKVDAIIFTAGVGENSDLLREQVTHDLAPMGISVDMQKNAVRGTVDISAADTRTKVFVIPTNEEAQIAFESVAAVSEASK